jgi:acid-sensing ion channel, other
MFVNKNSESKYKPIEWTLEGGFSEKPSNITVPRTAAGAGSHMGLSIILDANVNEYYCSSTSSSGFKVSNPKFD